MELLEALKTRRSIRKFKNQKVSDEDLLRIVDIAKYYPSWKNSQTVRFLAINNDEIKNEIAKNGVLGFDWNTKVINQSPTLVLVLTKENISGFNRDGSPTTPKGKHFESYDAGLATLQFQLAAYGLGYGTVIMGYYDEPMIKELVKIEAGYSISAVIGMGIPDEEPNAPVRKETEDLLKIIK